MPPSMDNRTFQLLPAEEQYLHCKALSFRLIHDGPLSPKELAFELGLSYRNLLKYGEEGEPGKNLLSRKLLAAMHRQQADWLVAELAGLFDFLVFRKPRGLACLPDLNRQISAVLKETAEAVQAVIAAVDPESPGGTGLTRQELAGIRAEIAAAHSSLASLEAAAARMTATPRHPHNPLGGGQP